MPQHPYTVGLMGAIPALGTRRARLAAINGMVPAANAMPAGCRFAARCPFADARCRRDAPPPHDVGEGHRSRCWKVPLQQLAASLPAEALA
jgi:oligopeptide/dipeptide ABC transporter ATP-binding protein